MTTGKPGDSRLIVCFGCTMRLHSKHAAPLLAGLLATAPALAEGPRFVTLTIENDSLLFRGLDRGYSSGLQLGVLLEKDDLPAWLREAPPFAWSDDRHVAFALGHRIYSPDDLTLDPPDPTDWPYAGWLYLMTDVRTRTGPVIDHLTATVGVVGQVARGQELQNAFHRIGDYPLARGWGSQVEDQFAWTIGYERAWRQELGSRYDVTPRVGAVVGNVFTYASAGVVMRYGSVLPDDIPATTISLAPSRDGFRGAPHCGWYAWAGVDARAVARNIFIEGRKPGGDTVKRETWGYDFQLGAAWLWPGGRAGFALVRRGPEFEGQKETDYFGQLTVSLAY